MEFKMDRNGAGYKDETAYKAFKGMAKAGEIWSYNCYGVEKEVLIIKNHGTHSNVLTLLDECKTKYCIEITSRSLKYTDPRMLQYLFNDNLSQFIKALTDEEFDNVLYEIEEAMELDIARADTKDALEAAQNRIKQLEEELEAERKKVVPSAFAQIVPGEESIYKRLYDDLIDKLIDKKVL